MCLARIEFVGNSENENRQPLIDVARIDITPSGFKVTELMGAVRQFAGKIQSIDFLDSVVRIENGKASSEGAQ